MKAPAKESSKVYRCCFNHYHHESYLTLTNLAGRTSLSLFGTSSIIYIRFHLATLKSNLTLEHGTLVQLWPPHLCPRWHDSNQSIFSTVQQRYTPLGLSSFRFNANCKKSTNPGVREASSHPGYYYPHTLSTLTK